MRLLFPGVLHYLKSVAEIKPVEPEQGNACEGKVYSFSVVPLHFAMLLFPNYFIHVKTKRNEKVFGNTNSLIDDC